MRGALGAIGASAPAQPGDVAPRLADFERSRRTTSRSRRPQCQPEGRHPPARHCHKSGLSFEADLSERLEDQCPNLRLDFQAPTSPFPGPHKPVEPATLEAAGNGGEDAGCLFEREAAQMSADGVDGNAGPGPAAEAGPEAPRPIPGIPKMRDEAGIGPRLLRAGRADTDPPEIARAEVIGERGEYRPHKLGIRLGKRERNGYRKSAHTGYLHEIRIT